MASPNCSLIEAMAAAKSAQDIYGMLDGSTFVEFAMDVIEAIWHGDFKDNLEKACILDFCLRHGGINWTNARRFAPVFQQRTNKCSHCHLQGHDANHCSQKMIALSRRWDHM